MGDDAVALRDKSNNSSNNTFDGDDYDFVIDREKRVTRMISIADFPPVAPFAPAPAVIIEEHPEPPPSPRPPTRHVAADPKVPKPKPRPTEAENVPKAVPRDGEQKTKPTLSAEHPSRRVRNPKYTRTYPLPMAGQDPKWQKDAADQNFDYMFKLLIIGNSSVGKTSFLFRYADDSFTSAFVSTVGIDFKVKTVFRHDKRVKLQIWDTAGQERYRTITTAYYRGAMGFILMYDITNEESFNSVQDWVTQIKTYSWDNAQVILVGNKCDMEDERVISFERGKQLAEQLGIEFFETSAKENINVKAVFERLVDIICDKMSESLDTDPNLMNAQKGTRLTETNQTGPQSPNCNC
ncbi:ras-related protein Rab-3 isoform X2 [Neocloeon triangulifer]|uniref:ras-related protein Rab-3 isoform X2 n=1 Tax=Neocloeon triangulifer TaxID=2078957 RepID=UPI00286F4510|nr:ras-related protein Rab-3 isoform X2 [Neocloeon triangulifer]